MVDWAGDVQFPLIVKPPQEDASLGITHKSIVHDVKELLEKIAELQTEYQQPALAEQFVEGREFYVGVLGNVNARALPIIEMDFSKFPADRPRIASWAAKWGDEGDEKGAEFEGTHSIFPTDLPDELRDRIQKVALERSTRFGFATTRASTCASPTQARSSSSRSTPTAISRRRANSRAPRSRMASRTTR
jgi:D-alanine-D-alanine ligase